MLQLFFIKDNTVHNGKWQKAKEKPGLNPSFFFLRCHKIVHVRILEEVKNIGSDHGKSQLPRNSHHNCLSQTRLL